MGTFSAPLPPTTHLIAIVNMILTTTYQSLESSDPWIVPSPLEFDALGDTMPLSLADASYVSIQSSSPSLDDQHLLAPDTYSMPSWLNSLMYSFDYISEIFHPMNLLWKCLELTTYLGMITIIDPLFFQIYKKYKNIYTVSSHPRCC
jgi:hypothetical protein